MSVFRQGGWGLKILSLVLAVILWVYVSNELNPTKEKEFSGVTVLTRGLGPDLTVTEMPGGVNVRVQAPNNLIGELSNKSIEAFADLTNVKPGKITVPLQVEAPAGVKVTKVTPQFVTINLEPFMEKQLPVKIRSSNAPEKGYKVLDIRKKPDEVIVRGPKSILEKIDSAFVDVGLRGRNKSFSETVPVVIGLKSGNLLKENLVSKVPSVVDIFVSIMPDLPTKAVPVVPVVNGKPAPGYAVLMTVTDPPELTVTGEHDLINDINQVFTQTVNLNGAENDVFIDVAPELPPGVTSNRQTLKVLVKIGRE